MITSYIADKGGVPTLFINEQPVSALAYITYFDEDGCFEQFAQAGYRLFSTSIFFGDQGVSVTSGIKPFSSGIFAQKGTEDFSVFDKKIERILTAVPDALIFPRVNTALSSWWERENPEECNDYGVNGGPARACFSSEKWLNETIRELRLFLQHVSQMPYRDHIFGYQIANGQTEEWMSFDNAGSNGLTARKAFAAFSPGDCSQTSFRHYLSYAAANAIDKIAAAAKEFTQHRLVIGSFYGYLFELPNWKTGHHALRKLLASPNVDFICSPASYINRLHPELDWPYMVPVHSLIHHGKLYFAEYDTRTCYTKYLPESHPGICPEGAYREPVWKGPDTEKETINLLRMNFSRQISNGHGSWWFDMWGGWFNSPCIMEEMALYQNWAEQFLHDSRRGSVAECAVWMDESSFSRIPDEQVQACLRRKNRNAIGQSGIPFDFYEMGDFLETISRYRAAIFVVPISTPELENALRFCRTHHLPYLEVRDEDELTSEKLRQFCQGNKIHCYCSDGSAIHVSHNMISIHAASSGIHWITLPEERRILPLGSDGKEFAGDKIVLEMEIAETRIFRLLS